MAADPMHGLARETRPEPTAEPPVVARQVVPGNRWDRLAVPTLGAWTPTRKVSVILPTYNAQDALEITLAALSEQTYPRELIEVVVADDGSNPPVELARDHRGLDVKVEHQEDRGFGLARARNLGARVATGDILVYLDCDMVPEPQHLEAHARWHHVCDHAVVLGFRRHVEFDGISADQVAEATAARDLEGLFGDRDQQVPAWIEGHMVRTDDLTSDVDDLFRVVTGGNASMRRDAYWAVGGNDESFTQWGAEDTELGFRLWIAGALLIPERAAMCWHQGHGHLPEPHELRSLEEQRAKIAHLIAHPGFRRARPGRSFQVPRLAVEVAVGDRARAEVVATVESLLSGSLSDLLVVIDVPEDHEERVWLSRDLGWDPRVVLGVDEVPASTPYRASVPAGLVVSRTSCEVAVRALSDPEDPIGVLEVELEDGPTGVRFVSERALGRARHAGADDPLAAAGELFGLRRVGGEEAGIRVLATEDLPAPSTLARGTASVGQDELKELWTTFSGMEPAQRTAIVGLARGVMATPPGVRSALVGVARRVLLLLTALRTLLRARDLRSLRRGVGQVLKALLPAQLFASLLRLLRGGRRADPT